MAKIVAKDTMKVFSFPESPERIKDAMQAIVTLTNHLSSIYGIELLISFENLHQQYPVFSEFLTRFYRTCMKYEVFSNDDGGSSPIGLLALCFLVIRDPHADARNLLGIFARGKEDFLQPLVDEARNRSHEWRSVIGLQVHMLRDARLLGDRAKDGHGIAVEDYRIALLIRNYPEIIYHEFLHLFGVSDGYNETTKATCPGCESCWMQWEPSCGKGLCQKHQQQLREFLVEKEERK